MNKKNFKVYLAGPITNCNEKQRSAWRKRMKGQLREEGFSVLDPTLESARKGALAVAADIEEADVVIANLWKESVGTVIGIVQARANGIPVILIDQHYIDSPVLESMVEREHRVRDESAALNVLKDRVVPALTREIQVEKKDGKVEPFKLRKLQNSLKAVLARAAIDDPISHILISRRAHRSIIDIGKTSPTITTRSIKSLVLAEIQKFVQDDVKMGFNVNSKLRDDWDVHSEIYKSESTDRTAYLSELEDEIEALSEELVAIAIERDNFAAQLKGVGLEIQASAEKATEGSSLLEGLRSVMKGRKGICISNAGRSSFGNVFDRLGVPEKEFHELFDEQILDGRQSNLNQYLEKCIKSARIILYAGDGLRHLHPNVREAQNLFSGCGPSDCIRRLMRPATSAQEM